MKKSCFLLLLFVSAISILMADNLTAAESSDEGKLTDESSTTATSSSDAAAVHIVHVTRNDDEEPEAYHVKTLASVLGSEEEARKALVYSYSHAISGFSARLTPQQAAELSKLPGVLQVSKSKTYQLHSGRSRIHKMGGF